jgi:hypothetical protein
LLLEVSAVVRTLSAVAAFAVAAVVVLVRRGRRLQREAVAQRLMAGCALRDSAVLAVQLAECRGQLERAAARREVVAAAGLVVDEALSAQDPIDPSPEGGPQ